MEYRCGSTRCEDDSLENEKGIDVAVRDAGTRRALLFSFGFSPLPSKEPENLGAIPVTNFHAIVPLIMLSN